MTHEDRDLLLKDIYARIPYGVKGCCEDETFHTTPLHWYAEYTLEYSVNYMIIKNGWRPYLFPLSNMTEEQKKDMIKSSCGIGSDKNVFDWYNKNHFDFRGLIEKGIAIDATGLNIY